jgi:hypothetical protein
VDERTLNTEQVQVERKTFVFLLKENPRGRFVCGSLRKAAGIPTASSFRIPAWQTS